MLSFKQWLSLQENENPFSDPRYIEEALRTIIKYVHDQYFPQMPYGKVGKWGFTDIFTSMLQHEIKNMLDRGKLWDKIYDYEKHKILDINLLQRVSDYAVKKYAQKFPQVVNAKDWKVKVINVKPSNFTEKNQQNWKSRGYGANPSEKFASGDEVRTARVHQIMQTQAPGQNDPVMIVYHTSEQKYELIEGFHRTMAMFQKAIKEQQNQDPTISIQALLGTY